MLKAQRRFHRTQYGPPETAVIPSSILMLLLVGCQSGVPAPPPTVTAIAPTEQTEKQSVHVIITGREFIALNDGEASGAFHTDSNIVVRFFGASDGEAVSFELENVARRSDSELEGDTPADIVRGLYSITVKSPTGGTSRPLENAYTVHPAAGSGTNSGDTDSTGDDTESESENESDTGIPPDTQSDTPSSTDTDGDTDNDVDTGTGSSTGGAENTDTGTVSPADQGSDSDTGTEQGASTETVTQTVSETGDAGTDASTGGETDTATDSITETGSATASATVFATATETDTDTATISETATASATATETEGSTASQTVTDSDTVTTTATGSEDGTCEDGVQNQDETGVDCGGSTCPPCPCSQWQYAAPEQITGIGSHGDFYGPNLSHDGLELYYSRYTTNDNLYVATRTDRGTVFSNAVQVDDVNSTNWAEVTPHITVDGLSLYMASNRNGTAGSRDIMVATRASIVDAFSTPTFVSELNSTAEDQLPWLSDDALTVLFVSKRLETGDYTADADVWMATRASVDDPFSGVTYLDSLNTSSDEGRAALSADGLTVYFSSDRPGGASDHDLYIATRPDTLSDFGTPVSLDALNSSSDDFDAALSSDGTEIFFVSNRSGDPLIYRSLRECADE